MAAFASAALHVHSEMPPMLLFHGTADHVVPYLQSVEFFERYLQKNNHNQIHLSLLEDRTARRPGLYRAGESKIGF